jgi:hypothetical protein
LAKRGIVWELGHRAICTGQLRACSYILASISSYLLNPPCPSFSTMSITACTTLVVRTLQLPLPCESSPVTTAFFCLITACARAHPAIMNRRHPSTTISHPSRQQTPSAAPSFQPFLIRAGCGRSSGTCPCTQHGVGREQTIPRAQCLHNECWCPAPAAGVMVAIHIVRCMLAM